MSEAGDYIRILEEIGIETARLWPNCGRILRFRDGRKCPGVYFNRSRYGGLHFTLNPNARVEPDAAWWNFLPDCRIKAVDHRKPNIVPKPGMERQALRQLLRPGAG